MVPTTQTCDAPAATLADLRRAANLTTRQVAAIIQKSQPRVTQLENSGVNRIDTLEKLARAYGVTLDTILRANDRVKDK